MKNKTLKKVLIFVSRRNLFTSLAVAGGLWTVKGMPLSLSHTHTHTHMTSEYNSLSSSLLFLHFILEWGTVLSSWFAALRLSVGTPRSQRSFQGAPWDPWESISLLLQGTWKRHARRVWVSPGDTAWTRRQLLVRFPHSKWKRKRRAAKLPFYLHQHWIKLRHN